MQDTEEIYSKEFTELVSSITNKRANIVINHILKSGFITTEDLENYGYKHAPRAARDVREDGIPLVTYNVKSSDGKSIAAYKFGDLTQLQANRSAGRVQFPKDFKALLYKLCDGRCSICNTKYEERYLQIDHRVPYEVGGDAGKDREIRDFMLLCSSCNRAKSWSCEHCDNWLNIKRPEVCMACYWGSPDNYNHIALHKMRRIDINWNEDEEVLFYDNLKHLSEVEGIALTDYIKKALTKIVPKE